MHAISLSTIQELIAAGHIVEARTLLTAGTPTLSEEERNVCLLEIDERQGRAEELIAQADAMEQKGQSEEAKALYLSVLEVAADFPGIQEHIKRMDETLFLAHAVQRRNKRIREATTQREEKKQSRRLPILGICVAGGLAAAALILVLNRPASPPPDAAEPTPPTATVPPAVQPAKETSATVLPASAQPPAPALPEPAADIPPAPSAPERPLGAAEHALESPLPASGPMPNTHSSDLNQDVSPPSAETPGPEHESSPAASDLYTVQPGDSLSLIAERQLCHEPSWQALYHLNQDQIADPRKLQPGMQLRLTGLEHRCPTGP